jgi:peroxiredoxin
MYPLGLPLLAALAAPLAAGPAVSVNAIGTRIDDFALRDPQGRTWRLSDMRDRKAVVVIFLAADCPLARLYTPRLVELAGAYQPRGVGFVAIGSNQHEEIRDLARYARLHAISFPVLKDAGNIIADRFAAERSPEAFVLDGEHRIRYRGRIDDQYGVGVQKPRATRRDLADALDAVLAGKAVSVPVTQAPGCPISRVERVSRPAKVSYCKDVAAILQQRCQVCHRPGQVAPFALTSYRDASGWAGAIREVIEAGRMPPWGADPKYGKFANDPSLTAVEKQKLLQWIDAGCPEGNPADLPAPVTFTDGWRIPGPDLVVSIPEPYTVPAEGTIEYVYIRVDPGFREDRWIRAAEIMPGNPAVVHHCNVFLQPPGIKDPENLQPSGKLGSFCLTQTAPGTPPMILPEGRAKCIPAGWRIVFVLHYQAIGSVQKDQTRLGLNFADPKTIRQEVATQLMYDLDLRIPPGASDHRVSQTWTVNRDVELLSLFPHMHLRGKSFRYEVIHPDGREEVLLDVPRWDFNWQHRYVLATPLRIPSGSRLRCSAVYDNSADNPFNPDSKADVRAGTQSWDEMFNGYFDMVLADQDLTRPVPWYCTAWQTAQGVCQPGVSLLACLAGGLYLVRRRVARALGATPPAQAP